VSLSNPTLTNPAEHFFEWAGSKGILQWYDKENKKNVLVKLPFEFIVLDQLSTITGYNKQAESGFWSNEVRNTKKDELYVRTKQGPFEAGLYEDLTQTMKRGGKFCKSIYLAHKGPGGTWIIGCFKASGSALSAWIEFTKRYNVGEGKIIMTKGEQQDAPTGPFSPPEFKWEKWDNTEYEVAVELDKELQIYLSQYLSAPKVDDDAHGIDEPPKATNEQQADFDNRRAGLSKSAADDGDPGPEKPDVVIEDIGDEPINLDDIPF
jgi:hypothetical protein